MCIHDLFSWFYNLNFWISYITPKDLYLLLNIRIFIFGVHKTDIQYIHSIKKLIFSKSSDFHNTSHYTWIITSLKKLQCLVDSPSSAHHPALRQAHCSRNWTLSKFPLAFLILFVGIFRQAISPFFLLLCGC